MKLQKNRYDDIVLLKFTGELETFNLPTFSERMDRMIEAGDREFILDLHLLKFINSAALGYLIRTAKVVREKGGEVVIARPSKFIRKTLVTLGLEQVFKVYETVEDGILHFKRGADVSQLRLEGETDETLTGSVPILFRRSTGAKDDAAPPNQVGRIVTLYDDGLLFRYSSTGPNDSVETQLTNGALLKVKFRQPFALREHYFEMDAAIVEVNAAPPAAPDDERVVTCRVKYSKIKDEDKRHLDQFRRDQDMWRHEVSQRP
jgi:anti-anti-sigma factor